jgi:hypothetical protein
MTATTAPAMKTVAEVTANRTPHARYAVQTGAKVEYFETLEFAYHRADEYSAGWYPSTPVVVFHLGAPAQIEAVWGGRL